MEKTKFNEGDMVQFVTMLVIPDQIRWRNDQLDHLLKNHKRPDFPPDTNDLGIIISTQIAKNYTGYIWFSQMKLQYYLVFEEELKKV